jgi:hypothetical protein
MQLGLVHRFDSNLEERRRAMAELGSTAGGKAWFLAAEAHTHYVVGRWDAALASIGALLTSIPEGQSHYLEPDTCPVRAWIEFGRDQEDEALADVNRGVKVASRSLDPQAFTSSLCAQTLPAACGRTNGRRARRLRAPARA